MDRYLLKNIIIIILVLVNGFLLGSLAVRQTSENRSRRQSEEQLVELFAADEITLDIDAISHQDPPVSLSFTRDTQRELEAAVFFLGEEVVQENQGGGINTYTSSLGTATFRSDGSFDIKGTLVSENAQSRCEKFCRALSFSEPVFFWDDAGLFCGKAQYLHNKLPVLNCSVTFIVEDGILTSVNGSLLPEEGTPVTDPSEPLTASAALIAFQKIRWENSAVVSAVTEMYPCYEMQSAASSSLSLVPAWCIVADTSNYYVNCITGAVASG